jgi:hypothetical protein
MTSLMILDAAKAELIAGGRRRPSLEVELSVKQVADAKTVFSSRAKASKGGENTVAASQDVFQLNNIGYAEFA